MKFVKTIIGLVMAGLTLYSASSAASTAHLNEVFSQIQVMNYSLNTSSISSHLSPARMTKAREQLQRAQELAQAGQYRTAEEMLRRVGQQIYSMGQEQKLSGYSSDTVWMRGMVAAIESMMPVAREIAQSKGRGDDALGEHQAVFDAGRDALARGQLDDARTLLEVAYLGLQKTLVNLRSGDMLVIELPEPGTQEAWVDAQRRYQDWLYTTQNLMERVILDSFHLSRIQQALDEAQIHYQIAGELAQGDAWAEAVAALDDAFALMEDSWRQIGIEI